MNNLPPNRLYDVDEQHPQPFTDMYGNVHLPDGSIKVAKLSRPAHFNRKQAPETEQAIAQAYADGDLRISEIAEEFSVSETSVRRIAQVHGVPLRVERLSKRITKVNVAKVIKLTRKGLTAREIAASLGQTRSAITNVRARTSPILFADEQTTCPSQQGGCLNV